MAAAVVVALSAATMYALAATLQYRAARREPTHATLDPRLLIHLLRRRMWLLGGAADLVGTALHGFALSLGPLALVQPILISGLLFAIPMEAAMDRRRPSRRDLIAVGLSGLGLAALVTITKPGPGSATQPNAALIDVSVAVGLLVTVLLLGAWRSAGSRRATLLGIACGALYALGAALAKTVVIGIGDDPYGLLTDWRLYALAPVGVAAMVLNQNAFQAGALAGPLTGITLTDPLVSIAIAVTAFQEHLSLGGLRTVLALIAAVVMACGVWLVSSAWSALPHRLDPDRA